MFRDFFTCKNFCNKFLIILIKVIIFLLVLYWLCCQLQKSWNEIGQYHWHLCYGWLVLSGVFYITALFPSSILWFFSLQWLGQKTSLSKAIVSYYLSQVGKYIPGKAMVIIIRAGVVAGSGVQPSIAATCVFYETLTMMGTGVFIASLNFLFCLHQHWIFLCFGLVLTLVFYIPLFPPVFIRILQILHISKNKPLVQKCLKKFKYSFLLKGFGLSSFSWLFQGLSLWATICGLGIENSSPSFVLPRIVSIVALATALGFIIPVAPGGLGIREGILSSLLVPFFIIVLKYPSNSYYCTIAPETFATITSILQRIITILAESVSVIVIILGIAFRKLFIRNKS